MYLVNLNLDDMKYGELVVKSFDICIVYMYFFGGIVRIL